MPNSRYIRSLDGKNQMPFSSKMHFQESPHPVRVVMEPRSQRNNAAPLLPPVPVSTVPGVENMPVPINPVHQRRLEPCLTDVPIILLIIRAATER